MTLLTRLRRLAILLIIAAVSINLAGLLGDMFNRPTFVGEATLSLILLFLLTGGTVFGIVELFNRWRKEDASHEDPQHTKDTHTS